MNCQFRFDILKMILHVTDKTTNLKAVTSAYSLEGENKKNQDCQTKSL